MAQNPISPRQDEYVDAVPGSEVEDVGGSMTGEFESGEASPCLPSDARYPGSDMAERDLPSDTLQRVAQSMPASATGAAQPIDIANQPPGGTATGVPRNDEASTMRYAGAAGQLEPQYPDTRMSRYHTVAQDDTLRSIAERYYGDANHWQRIFEANQDRLDSADLIYPGQQLAIP